MTIDMTVDGRFRAAPKPPLSAKVLAIALLVAGGAAALAFAALALWLALILIPVAIGAALVAYGVLRYRLWRATRSGAVPPDILR